MRSRNNTTMAMSVDPFRAWGFLLTLLCFLTLGSANALAEQALHLANTSAANFGYVRILDSPGLEPQQITIEAWITPQGPGYGNPDENGGELIVAKGREGGSGTHLASYGLGWVSSTSRIQFRITHTMPSEGRLLTSHMTVPIGVSAHVAGTFDGVTLRLFVNGIQDTTVAYGYNGIDYGPDDVLLGAGNYSNNFLRRFDGIIDEVRLWDHALDETTIADRMNCRLSGSEAGLLAYWTFNASDLLDQSGGGHNGTAVGPGVGFVPEPVLLGLCGAFSSTSEGDAFPVSGSLGQQIQTLNDGPPAFPDGWQPVHRHTNLHTRAAFLCGDLGHIISVAGASELISTPPSVDFDILENNTRIRVFTERQGTTLTTAAIADARSPGVYDEDVDLPSGGVTIAAGSVVSSHLLHFDTVGSQEHRASGSVTFDSEILGVCLVSAHLFATDAALGAPGSTYPASYQREVELGVALDDSVIISADRRTITLVSRVTDWNDQLRVLTAASPASPLAMPYVDSESFLAGADEVTLDNCGSAFYRFTFNLPPHQNPNLSGRVNADDIAVAFLNGARISPELLVSDNFGTDRTEDGKALLSGPTTDTFGTSQASLFRAGENELIFGVCGDAGPSEPTGLEFSASVLFDSLDVSTVPPGQVPDGAGIRLLAPNPNPVSRGSTFRFSLPTQMQVELAVFDVAGRKVMTLLDAALSSGNHTANWDGLDSKGSPVSSGVYFVRLTHGTEGSVQRFLLVR